ncbi:hypothetical protein ACHAW6_000620 [Cyclotella cf. meneghiniana]
MNSQLARAFFKRSQLSQRFSSGAPFPTTSTVESGGFKVVGLPYLSTPAMRAEYTKTNWLSDPSTYPLLVVLAGAGCLCTGFGCYFLATAPDVQISPLKRSAKSANLLFFFTLFTNIFVGPRTIIFILLCRSKTIRDWQ